jgi:hypothetical protein
MKARNARFGGGLVVLLVACIVLVVSAFSQSEKLELLIWETDELDMQALFETVRGYARESFVGVEVLSISFSEYWDQLLARLTGGDPPDLFWVTNEMLRELAELGLIIPLDDAIGRRPQLLVSRQHRFEDRQFGIQVGPSRSFADIAYAVPRDKEYNVGRAAQFIGYIQQRWPTICCFELIQPNPPLNTAIAAHGNTDWHIDTANEFLFGTDMGGSTTATNHCPNSWTRRHIHVGLANTNHFYYDSDLITSGDDTDATSGIDTAMLFFYAGHGFPPNSWDTLGNKANVSNVSIGDDPGWGLLRYYWQCSCTVFAHGADCCPGDTCSATHPCPGAQDWWYQCPGQFTGASDSVSTPNVYERWGVAINPNLRMACGASTCGYCHENQMNSIWNNYNNLGYDVADSFIDGLTVGSVVPLCISMGGYNLNLNPLVADTSFTNQPNTSGTSHYYIQYLSTFASSKIGGILHLKLPELLAKQLVVRPRPIPRQWLDDEYRIDKEWMYSPDEIDDRGPRVRINQLSGAMYIAGPSTPITQRASLSEQAYTDLARRHVDQLGWGEELVSEPMGSRMMIAAVPLEQPERQELIQKNVTVYLKRLVDVEGTLVPVLGEGGVIEVQMNNDGSLLNASKVWREIVDFAAWEPVKPYEQALNEALGQTKRAWAYELDDWAWGYVEAAGNEVQEVMQLVYRFWLTPLEQAQLRDLPPVMIEIPA